MLSTTEEVSKLSWENHLGSRAQNINRRMNKRMSSPHNRSIDVTNVYYCENEIGITSIRLYFNSCFIFYFGFISPIFLWVFRCEITTPGKFYFYYDHTQPSRSTRKWESLPRHVVQLLKLRSSSKKPKRCRATCARRLHISNGT